MKTSKKPLSQVRANADNPRTISDENLQLLVNSILEFPKMLEIRPLVTDAEGVILGGNMRHKALTQIAAMKADDLRAAIRGLRSTQERKPDEVDKLIADWTEWLEKPFAYVVEAQTLTEAERQEFVIKDNVNFGQWDWDALDNFKQEELQDWGVQTWGALQPLTAPGNTPQGAVADNRQRIIIIFPRERRQEVEQLLKLPQPSKPVYKISEILNQAQEEQTDEDSI